MKNQIYFNTLLFFPIMVTCATARQSVSAFSFYF